MHLTFEEYQSAPDVRAKLMAMQAAAKGAEQPRFKLTGPMSLNVRRRPNLRSGRVLFGGGKVRGNSTEVVEAAFMGGEQFALSDVYTHQKPAERTLTVLCTFQPRGDAGLVADIVSMTLPLAEAADVFEGFEKWMTDLPVTSPGNVRAPDAAAKPLTKEQKLELAREENDEYGAF